MRRFRLFSMIALSVAAMAGPAYSVELTPEERKTRNLETLKGEKYYELMDSLDKLITDGLGFSESAFDRLNDLFRTLKTQDPDRFELIRKAYPGVFENLDVE